MGPILRETHDDVLSWLNSLIIDLKYWMIQREEQPVIPDRHLASWKHYREELEGCFGQGQTHIPLPEPQPASWPASIHRNEIKVLDALVDDLVAIWHKQEPKRPITEARLNEVENAERALKECRYDPRHY
ncbi:MAG: hypothetical protein WC455_19095 [Dehalococcoidia bacterium]|jgi:hypothetical protein